MNPETEQGKSVDLFLDGEKVNFDEITLSTEDIPKLIKCGAEIKIDTMAVENSREYRWFWFRMKILSVFIKLLFGGGNCATRKN